MAGHGKATSAGDERLVLGEEALPLVKIGRNVAVLGLVGAAVAGSANGFQGFFYAYLAAYAFFLSIVLGAMFFVLMHHLTAAGWSVVVRRLAESLMKQMPLMALLAVPIVLTVVLQSGKLYPWAGPITSSEKVIKLVQAGKLEQAVEATAAPETETGEASAVRSRGIDPFTLQIRITGIRWLNPYFFTVRLILYFAIWMGIARWYFTQSVRQDTTGDIELSRSMQKWAGFLTVVFGLTLTGFAGDVLMSLDPHWYSTMWAVYYFAGCVVAIFATLILMVALLQAGGYLRKAVNIEHYHDLGKYLFAFTFFYGYISFSQYMLLWYANIPDEIMWWNRHGATTDPKNITGWSYVILVILFCQILIPFGGLMSRHVKRATGVLVFWALWQLSFHLLDIYWIVMPEYPGKFGFVMVLSSLCAYIGIGGIFLAVLVRGMVGQTLRPLADPRLPESLAFHNI